jgi:hypothetical protein
VYTVPTDPSPLRSVAIGTTTISPSGSGTVTFGGTGITSGAVNSIGSGSGVIVAGVPNQSAITAAGVGSAAIVGRGIPGTSISGIGSGSASFAGRSIVGGAVASTGLGSAAIGGRLLKPARLSAAGVSGAALVSRAGKVAIVVSMGQGRAQFGGAYVSIIRQRIPVKSIRILFEMIWPDDTITRLWDGSGPFVTEDGNIWIGLAVLQGLDAIELAMNGEASTLTLALTGTSSTIGDLVWLSNSNDEIIGAKVRMMIQQCDADDQPIGTPEVRFTGTIDNIVFDDRTSNEDGTDGITSTVTVEVTNLFTLRRLLSGSVLSDIDQQARSLITNPTQTGPDRSCERVPLMADQTIVWPRWN